MYMYNPSARLAARRRPEDGHQNLYQKETYPKKYIQHNIYRNTCTKICMPKNIYNIYTKRMSKKCDSLEQRKYPKKLL